MKDLPIYTAATVVMFFLYIVAYNQGYRHGINDGVELNKTFEKGDNILNLKNNDTNNYPARTINK